MGSMEVWLNAIRTELRASHDEATTKSFAIDRRIMQEDLGMADEEYVGLVEEMQALDREADSLEEDVKAIDRVIWLLGLYQPVFKKENN